jgi:purine-nucleoside phosphorylase
MLKDLTKGDWLALLDIPEDRIPDVLVLRGTRNLKIHYDRHRALFTEAYEIGSPNGIVDSVMIGVYRQRFVGYASVYGDAMASEVTHIFGVLGTPLVIQTGCCGALADGMQVGDLVAVTSAHCGEGAAQYYVPGRESVDGSPGLVDRMLLGRDLRVGVHEGPVWTTSALMAEGRAEIEHWRQSGYVGVDMETASTFAVAEYFRMQRCSLLFVFDTPREGGHIMLTDAGKRERRQLGNRAMIDAVFSYIEKSG